MAADLTMRSPQPGSMWSRLGVDNRSRKALAMAFKITYQNSDTEQVKANSYMTGQDGVWIEFLNQYDPVQVLLVRADDVARIEYVTS